MRRIAAVLALALLLGAGCSDDEPSRSGTSSTTRPPAGTSTTVRPGVRADAVWPPQGRTFATPETVTRSFAVDLLGFRDPVIGPFRQGDNRSGEVDIRPRATGPVTMALVRQLGPGDAWSVIGATTEHIELDAPLAGAAITSPLVVRGRAVAFEGTVLVQVRTTSDPEPLGSGFVTGGGDVLRPFEGRIAFRSAAATPGVLVLFTDSAENGEVWEAVAVPVVLTAS